MKKMAGPAASAVFFGATPSHWDDIADRELEGEAD